MKYLFALLIVSSAACHNEVPGGYHVKGSDAAQAFIRSYYFMPASAERLDVKVTSPNCRDPQGLLTGIVNPTDGECVWAVTDNDETFISLRATKWSEMSLAHEIMHLVVGDPYHTDVKTWGTRADAGWNGGRVGMANTALSLNPELDLVGEPVL